jgi:cytochrome b subunit of formate dehydrogenase
MADACSVRRDLGTAIAAVVHPAPRQDEVIHRTGGPAGNARLTAWLGMALIVVLLVEGITLLSLHSLVGVHIVVGTLAVPLVLAKTASTGWRIAQYYLGSPAYRRAGPPPLALRILGPSVIVMSLAVLGTGLALVPLGRASFAPLFTIGGADVSAVALHKIAFVGWFVVTSVHVLTRFLPATTIIAGDRGARVPGRSARAALVGLSLMVGVVAGVVVLDMSHEWTHGVLGATRLDGGEPTG